MVATQQGGYIYYSHDSGVSWFNSSAPYNDWRYVTGDEDGVNWAVVTWYAGIWTSSDSGVSWQRTNAPTDPLWTAICSSSDGSFLAAVSYCTYSSGECSDITLPGNGSLYISTNYGGNWGNANLPPDGYRAVACSSTGQYVMTGRTDNSLYVSSDYGQRFDSPVILSNDYPWRGLTINGDGSWMTAAQEGGGIWFSTDGGVSFLESGVSPTPGPTLPPPTPGLILSDISIDSSEFIGLAGLCGFMVFIGVMVTHLQRIFFKGIVVGSTRALPPAAFEFFIKSASICLYIVRLFQAEVNGPLTNLAFGFLITSKMLNVFVWVVVMIRLLTVVAVEDAHNVDNVCLSALMYRPALGYIKEERESVIFLTDVNTNRLINSRWLFFTFPSYVMLIVFSVFDVTFLKFLPWLKTSVSTALHGYPSIRMAKFCLYGNVCSAALQVVASLLYGYLSGSLFIGVSVIALMYNSVYASVFIQFNHSDQAKLALVDETDLQKIRDYDNISRMIPKWDRVTFDSKYTRDSARSGNTVGIRSRGSTGSKASMMSLEDLVECGVVPASTVDGVAEDEVTLTNYRGAEAEAGSGGIGQFSTDIPFAAETQQILVSQLKEAGKIPLAYIPLIDLQQEIASIVEVVNRGEAFDEARLDFLLMCLDAHPQYKAEQAEQAVAWRAQSEEFMAHCLRTMRSYVPPNICALSEAALQTESGYSAQLCHRLISKKCLWLVRLSPEDIGCIHEADFMNKFNPACQALDVVEMAAIFAQLPQKFPNDASGKKERFRGALEQNVKGLMEQQQRGTLRKALQRHPCYLGAQAAYEPRLSTDEFVVGSSQLSSDVAANTDETAGGDTFNPMAGGGPAAVGIKVVKRHISIDEL